jgi:L-xylulokinase
VKYLLGTDPGSTMCKAALFDEEGRQVAVAGYPVGVMFPNPGWREVDPETVWRNTAAAIADVISASGVDPRDIAAVGPSGAGNGGYFLDAQGRPVCNAVQSSDSRAARVAERLNREAFSDTLGLLHEWPAFAGETPVIGRWLKETDPDAYGRVAHVAVTKDYFKYRLTGVLNSDRTDVAVAGFAEHQNATYSREIVELVGVPELWDTLPPYGESWEVVGGVLPEAAEATGLLPGTPVVSGVHDVEACALGAGAVHAGDVVVIAGTWNMNMVMLDHKKHVGGMFILESAVPGIFHILAMGATSAANLDWFIRTCCGDERAEAAEKGCSVYDIINAQVEGLSPEGFDLVYHPFLHTHGGDLPPAARAGFYGISGWHTKAHLLRALFEWVTFGHLAAFQVLRSLGLPMVQKARMTGGAAKSEVWSQMFADVLEMEMVIGEAGEVGALGGALCAGVGVGIYADLKEAAEKAVRVARSHAPDAGRSPIYHQRYAVYEELLEAMRTPWESLSALVSH